MERWEEKHNQEEDHDLAERVDFRETKGSVGRKTQEIAAEEF